jgi:hypothetical protein
MACRSFWGRPGVRVPCKLAGLWNYSLSSQSTLFSTFWDTHLRRLEALTNLLSENRIIDRNKWSETHRCCGTPSWMAQGQQADERVDVACLGARCGGCSREVLAKSHNALDAVQKKRQRKRFVQRRPICLAAQQLPCGGGDGDHSGLKNG